MIIKLGNDWYGPDGIYRDRLNNPHEVPDDWADAVPSSAEVIEGPKGARAATTRVLPDGHVEAKTGTNPRRNVSGTKTATPRQRTAKKS